MSQPQIIVYSTADIAYVPMLDSNNVFTGTNTFNVVNGTVGTISTLNSTIGTIPTLTSSTVTLGSVTIKNGTTIYSENTTDASYTIMTNSTASPQSDGFNIKWQNTGVGTVMGTNNDCLIFEKTDGNNADPDGAIQFVMTGNDGTQETAMNIWGNKVVEMYGTLIAPAGTIHTLTNGTINSTHGTFTEGIQVEQDNINSRSIWGQEDEVYHSGYINMYDNSGNDGGGIFQIFGGRGKTSTDGDGGKVQIYGGQAAGTGTGADVEIHGGGIGDSGTPGNVIVYTGDYSGAVLDTSLLSSNQTFTFPDFTGTVALASDLENYLPLIGGTLTGDLKMQSDSKKYYAGAGDDMTIWYDGTDGNIKTSDVAASDLNIDCGANKTIELQNVVYDDLRVTPGSFDRPGASDPTIKAVTPGGGTTTYLYEFAVNNIASFTVQLPHSYKTGEDIKVHIHWTPGDRGTEEDTNKVGWKIDYTWANINGVFGAMATADCSDACNGVGWEHNMTPEVTIDGHTAAKGISSMLICNIKRTDTGTDDTWASSTSGQLPLLLEIDFHFPIDTLGSRDWGTK